MIGPSLLLSGMYVQNASQESVNPSPFLPQHLLFSTPPSTYLCVHIHTPSLHIMYGIYSLQKYVPGTLLDARATEVRDIRSVLT